MARKDIAMNAEKVTEPTPDTWAAAINANFGAFERWLQWQRTMWQAWMDTDAAWRQVYSQFGSACRAACDSREEVKRG
jgi:hypothetical protein